MHCLHALPGMPGACAAPIDCFKLWCGNPVHTVGSAPGQQRGHILVARSGCDFSGSGWRLRRAAVGAAGTDNGSHRPPHSLTSGRPPRCSGQLWRSNRRRHCPLHGVLGVPGEAPICRPALHLRLVSDMCSRLILVLRALVAAWLCCWASALAEVRSSSKAGCADENCSQVGLGLVWRAPRGLQAAAGGPPGRRAAGARSVPGPPTRQALLAGSNTTSLAFTNCTPCLLLLVVSVGTAWSYRAATLTAPFAVVPAGRYLPAKPSSGLACSPALGLGGCRRGTRLPLAAERAPHVAAATAPAAAHSWAHNSHHTTACCHRQAAGSPRAASTRDRL